MQQTTNNFFQLNFAQVRNRRRIHRTVLVLLAGLLFVATAGIGKAQKPNGVAPPDELKVMTWNIDGGGCGTDRSMAPFAQVIRDHSPDVVAIQEIHRDQALRLARAAGFYPPYFVQTKDCRRADFGLAIMSRYPFEAGSQKEYSFFVFNHPLDTWRGEFRKMIGVNIRLGGQLIRIYDTHLTAIGKSFRYRNYFREQQVGVILRSIIRDEGNPGPSVWPILMGDFNSQPGTYPYVLVQRMFEDANPHHNTTSEGTRVDYIFLRRNTGLSIVDAGVLSTGSLSDHFPVLARLSFNLLND